MANAVENPSQQSEAVLNMAGYYLHKIAPVIRQYQLLAKWLILELILMNKTTCRLQHNVLSAFTNLFKNGFNIPPEKQKEGDEQNNVSGVGIGQGEGDKDVSDQIEHEEQVLDLQGEKQEETKQQQERSKEEKEKGMEMENDFSGDLENLDREEENSEDDDEKKIRRKKKKRGKWEKSIRKLKISSMNSFGTLLMTKTKT